MEYVYILVLICLINNGDQLDIYLRIFEELRSPNHTRENEGDKGYK